MAGRLERSAGAAACDIANRASERRQPGRCKAGGGWGIRAGILRRLDYGPGYRVYYMQRGALVIVLLAGGDKRTQDADIKLALKIAQDWKE